MTAAAEPTIRTDQDRAKWAAARFAAERYAFDGARMGLGSGTTSHFFVYALAERVRAGLGVVGVATSIATHELAVQLGVPMVELDDVGRLDVCLDGLDEIDPDGTMIKGGGACLLWEKIVATSSDRWIGLADPSKAVPALGRFPLPIEITRFSHRTTTEAVRALLAARGYPEDLRITLRQRDGQPLVTDNDNFLIDAELGRITDCAELTVALNTVPGVVENGLFVGIAREVVVGEPGGEARAHPVPFGSPVPGSPMAAASES